MRSPPVAAHLLALAALAACSGGGGGNNTPAQTPPASNQRSSSTIALTADDQRLLAVDPTTDTLSVFAIVQQQPVKGFELPVGSDPRSVAVTSRGDKAYVANAAAGTVSVIGLGSSPQVLGTIAVGTEPRAVVINDADTRAFVANSGSSSISVIDTATDQVVATMAIDAAVGREPRALAYRRDGTRERLFAAMFFAELRPGKTGLDKGQDDSEEGRVAIFDAASLTAAGQVALEPMANTGFLSNGSVLDHVGTTDGQGGTDAPDPTNPPQNTFPTPAYPNQLASLAIHPGTGRAYVVSTGASPNGPFAFNVNVQGLVSVFDTATGSEVTGDATATVHQKAPLNLNQGLNQDTATTPRLFLSNPVAIAFTNDGSEAWIAVQQADVIVRMTVDTNGLPTINAPVLAGASSIARVDLQAVAANQLPGKAPIGLAIDSTHHLAYVHNFVSRSVSVVDLQQREVVATAATTPSPAAGTPEAVSQLGAELFFTGRGPQGRMSAAAWGSCAICHPHGLTDGVTWAFDAGPRQTIALDGMFNRFHADDQRILNWSAVRDENQDFEQNTRGVSGGTGLIDDDRCVFLAGGTAGAGPTDSAQVLQYQQTRNEISANNDLAGSPLPALPSARRDFGMATLNHGRILIVGGRTGAGLGSLVGAADAVLLFDPRTNTLIPRSSTGFTIRHSLGLAAADTIAGPRVYAVGGYATTTPGINPVALVQEYDPALDRWRDVASLPEPLAEFGIATNGPLNVGEPATELDVLCGNTGTEQTPVLTGALRRFTPDPLGLGAWRTLTFAFTPRRNLGAAAVVRGVFPSHVFAIGGRDATGTALPLVEAFAATTSQTAPTDPTTAVTPLTNLPAPRHSFAIGTASNRIQVFGGVDENGADTATVFEYNPAANPATGTAGPPGTPSGVWATRAALPTALRDARASTPLPVANFLAARSAGRDPRQDAIAEWIRRAVRSPVAPLRGSIDPSVTAGRALFAQLGLTGPATVSCASCHGGPKWTHSTVAYTAPPSPDLAHGTEEVRGAELRRTTAQPSVLFDVGTFVPFTAGRLVEARPNPTDVGQRVNALGANGFNIPSLLGVAATAPYFHHGMAATLEQVLDGSLDGNGTGALRSVHHVADAAQRAQLVAFLRSIDETSVSFP
jgi:YVTN family beta-propeller protein